MLRASRRPWAPLGLAIGTLVLGAGAASAAGPRAGEPRVIELPDAVDIVPPVPPIAPMPPMAALPRLAPRGWFGLGLTCEHCSISVDDSTGEGRWKFRSVPSIYSVDPGSPAEKAGIEPGDRLTHIDGVSITSNDGGRRFGAVRPGDKVSWTIDHDGKTRVVPLVAEEHPDREEFDGDVSVRVRDALDKLRMQSDQLRAERDRMRERSGGSADESRYFEAMARNLEMSQRELERTYESMVRHSQNVPRVWPTPRVFAIPSTPAASDPDDPPRHLRYQGAVGGSKVEVRGSGSVVVSEEHGGDLLITTPDATIRIQKKR